MAKRFQKASTKPRGLAQTLRTDPRSEVVFDKRALTGLLAELKTLSERSGSVLGDAYARAASSLLNGRERLEDLNAERRFRRRSKARPPSAGARDKAVRAISSEAISSTRK